VRQFATRIARLAPQEAGDSLLPHVGVAPQRARTGRPADPRGARQVSINQDLRLASFTRDLAIDTAELDDLEYRLASVLSGLAALSIRAARQIEGRRVFSQRGA
jgi:hypothetical protein